MLFGQDFGLYRYFNYSLIIISGEGLESAHHPFTAPYPGDETLLHTHPEQVCFRGGGGICMYARSWAVCVYVCVCVCGGGGGGEGGEGGVCVLCVRACPHTCDNRRV